MLFTVQWASEQPSKRESPARRMWFCHFRFPFICSDCSSQIHHTTSGGTPAPLVADFSTSQASERNSLSEAFRTCVQRWPEKFKLQVRPLTNRSTPSAHWKAAAGIPSFLSFSSLPALSAKLSADCNILKVCLHRCRAAFLLALVSATLARCIILTNLYGIFSSSASSLHGWGDGRRTIAGTLSAHCFGRLYSCWMESNGTERSRMECRLDACVCFPNLLNRNQG